MTAHQRGYTVEWQRFRLRWLREHPFCVHCQQRGVLTEARDVDHIIPHRGNPALFWNRANLQSLCASCHAAKTRDEMNNPAKYSGTPPAPEGQGGPLGITGSDVGH